MIRRKKGRIFQIELPSSETKDKQRYLNGKNFFLLLSIPSHLFNARYA